MFPFSPDRLRTRKKPDKRMRWRQVYPNFPVYVLWALPPPASFLGGTRVLLSMLGSISVISFILQSFPLRCWEDGDDGRQIQTHFKETTRVPPSAIASSFLNPQEDLEIFKCWSLKKKKNLSLGHRFMEWPEQICPSQQDLLKQKASVISNIETLWFISVFKWD